MSLFIHFHHFTKRVECNVEMEIKGGFYLSLLKIEHDDVLINEFKNLHKILSRNMYIRDTTYKLHRILDDATSHVQILLIGKERVGKSSLINAILGRDLIPIVENCPTEINMFIKYAEQEHIEITFHDGYVATFDMNKLPFFVTLNIENVDSILEHINYITVYINHDLLKKITLIDTHAIEIVNNETAFFSEIILNRVDEIFWIIRAGSPLTDDELSLLRKISARHMKPYVVVNAIDDCTNSTAFIASENLRYSQYIENIIGVSALLANEASKTNNTQSLIDSNFPSFTQLLKNMADQIDKKIEHTAHQLNDWLLRLRKEIELISSREPYLSAVELVKLHQSEQEMEYSKEQRDLAIVKTFEEEYKQCSTVFKSIQTLYQILKVLSENLFLRDEYTENFEEKATDYLKDIRTYRTLYSEYLAQKNIMQKNIKSSEEKDRKLHLKISPKGNKLQLQDLIILLNEKQAVLSSVYSSIKLLENDLVSQLNSVQQRMNDLANAKLQTILKQVEQLNKKRHIEYKTLISSKNKLEEFDCLTEAQKYIVTVIKEKIANNEVIENRELKQQMLQTIQFIAATELEHQSINKTLQIDEQLTVPIVVQFEQQNPFIPLTLDKNDIISQLSRLPLPISTEIQ